jgi:hypothetical protein
MDLSSRDTLLEFKNLSSKFTLSSDFTKNVKDKKHIFCRKSLTVHGKKSASKHKIRFLA